MKTEKEIRERFKMFDESEIDAIVDFLTNGSNDARLQLKEAGWLNVDFNAAQDFYEETTLPAVEPSPATSTTAGSISKGAL